MYVCVCKKEMDLPLEKCARVCLACDPWLLQYVCVMVITSSLGELMVDQILQYY